MSDEKDLSNDEKAVSTNGEDSQDILPHYDLTPQEPSESLASLGGEDAQRFQQGVTFLLENESLKALHLWRELVEAYPGLASVHYNLALACVQVGEHYQAMQHFKSAYQLNSSLEVANTNRAEALKGALFWDMINGAFTQKCRELQNQEDIEGLFETIEKHLSTWPFSFAGRERLAMALFFNGRSQEAIEQANLAIFINPNQPGGYYARARALSAIGEHEDAFAELKRCIELHQEHHLKVAADMWLRLADFAHVAIMSRKGANGQPVADETSIFLLNAMCTACSAVLNDEPDNEIALFLRGRGQMLLHISKVAGVKANLNQAKQDLERLVQLNPAHPEATQHLQLLGQFQDSQAEPSSAEIEHLDQMSDQFRDLVEAQPRDEDGILHLLEDDSMIERGEEILRLLEEMHARYPNSRDVRYSLATHLYCMSDMYWDVVVPPLMQAKPVGGMLGSGEAAHRACRYAHASYELVPHPTSAGILAIAFDFADFYATAIYWAREVERIAEPDSAITRQWRNRRGELESQGKIHDPLLSSVQYFPRRDTPGLRLEFQAQAETRARQAEAEARRKFEEEQERKRQQEAEAARRRQEEQERQRQQAEAERHQRISADLCVNCGKPLGFMDKMAKRQAHTNC